MFINGPIKILIHQYIHNLASKLIKLYEGNEKYTVIDRYIELNHMCFQYYIALCKTCKDTNI